MIKAFRPYDPLLIPASLEDWLPEDHLSYVLSNVVDRLDLS